MQTILAFMAAVSFDAVLFIAYKWAAITLFLLVATFTLYLAVIKLRDMQEAGTLDDLHWSAKGIAYLILYTGYFCDAMLNWIGLTISMLEWPQEILCTERVRRLKVSGTGWRRVQAIWWCSGWLTPVDTRHCVTE